MKAIAVVTIVTTNKSQRFVTNLTPTHQQIIAYFELFALNIYGLSKSLAPPVVFPLQTKKIDNDKNRLAWCEM